MLKYLRQQVNRAVKLIRYFWSQSISLSLKCIQGLRFLIRAKQIKPEKKCPFILGLGTCPLVNIQDEEDRIRYINTIYKLMDVE